MRQNKPGFANGNGMRGSSLILYVTFSFGFGAILGAFGGAMYAASNVPKYDVEAECRQLASAIFVSDPRMDPDMLYRSCLYNRLQGNAPAR